MGKFLRGLRAVCFFLPKTRDLLDGSVKNTGKTPPQGAPLSRGNFFRFSGVVVVDCSSIYLIKN